MKSFDLAFVDWHMRSKEVSQTIIKKRGMVTKPKLLYTSYYWMQTFTDALQNRCSKKFRKVCGKTRVLGQAGFATLIRRSLQHSFFAVTFEKLLKHLFYPTYFISATICAIMHASLPWRIKALTYFLQRLVTVITFVHSRLIFRRYSTSE